MEPAGPDLWRIDFPFSDEGGLCPRCAVLGELMTHRRRILTPAICADGVPRPARLGLAGQTIVQHAAGKRITILLTGNLPCEQIAATAAWCQAWAGSRLCLVIEPAEEALLSGLEASEATILPAAALAECDGFVCIGDVFAAGPPIARAVLDRRAAGPRLPIVAIDPAVGVTAKFATHRLDTAPGAEHAVLAALAAAAGVDLDRAAVATDTTIAAAGAAIAECKKLAVLVTAEYGRSASWVAIGYLAGRLAGALGGGVVPQTTGLNALAAVRLAAKLGTIPLGEALSSDDARIAIGCDVPGMLGRPEMHLLAAAAALPNRATEAAKVILPTAMPGEYGGTYLTDGAGEVNIEALLPAPAGVPTPVGLLAALATAAGATPPAIPAPPTVTDASAGRAPERIPPPPAPPAPLALLTARRAADAGCGSLTGWGSWQQASEPLPTMRIAPADAKAAGVPNLGEATVSANERSLRVRVRADADLPAGRIVLPAGVPEVRALNPCTIDPDTGAVVAAPIPVSVSP